MNEYAELEKRVSPNTYVVLTVAQGISNEVGSFIAGSEEVYDRVAKSLLNQISRRAIGKRKWRRTRRNLPNITTLEGRNGTDWHINICIRRPDDVTIEKFREIVMDSWRPSKWHRRNMYVEDYTGGALKYSLKEGTESILLGPTHFD